MFCGIQTRSPLQDVWLALLAATLVGACGTRRIDPSDASPADGSRDDTTNGSADDAALGDGEALPAMPADRSWIYVATDKGVERIKATGGVFVPFGLAAPTRSVFPSPSGLFVAQELADHRVAIFENDGSPRESFDIRAGLLGWSDERTLLFRDPQTTFLQQTSTDGQTRRYLPLPAGLQVYGYTAGVLSPDRSLLAVLAEPFARDNIPGSYLLVLSAVDGTLVRHLGVTRGGGPAWTGDGRLLAGTSPGQGFQLFTLPSGASTPLLVAPALNVCGVASWYEDNKVVVGKTVFPPGSDAGSCVSVVLNVVTGDTVAPGDMTGGSSPLAAPAFAQSADGREAAVADGAALEVGPVAGGARRDLGVAMSKIVGIGWAHPTPGVTNLIAPQKPVQMASALAGAPAVSNRSGGNDCRTGRWVNRTPNPRPAGWPGPRSAFSFAFDTDRGTLLVEGGYAGNLGTLPNLDYETMAWNGERGQWTNMSRPDGFGPASGRAMAYDARHKVVLALGTDLLSDGPWTWTPEMGWKNLRASAFVGETLELE
jgi:hypothetical protein